MPVVLVDSHPALIFIFQAFLCLMLPIMGYDLWFFKGQKGSK
jgi:hypothetical protein